MQRRYPSQPCVGVGGVIWKGDCVLLIRRGREPRQGQWSLPGGAQELGETLTQALVREVREETGIEFEIGPLIDVIDSIEREGDGVRYHWTLVDFGGRWKSGEPAPGGDVLEARWFTLAEITGLALWPETRRIIELSRRHDRPSGQTL